MLAQLMDSVIMFDGIFSEELCMLVDIYGLSYLLYIYFQVGLAVDDIKGIQEAASLKKLALQVRSNHQVW